jgi:hypothetical protein
MKSSDADSLQEKDTDAGARIGSRGANSTVAGSGDERLAILVLLTLAIERDTRSTSDGGRLRDNEEQFRQVFEESEWHCAE